MAKSQKTVANKLSSKIALANLPAYTFDNAVHDAMSSKSTEGKAEAGMVVALFNDEQWSMKALNNYFGAPKTQTVIVDGVKRIDKNIGTRAKIAQAFLSRSVEYKNALDAFNATQAELKEANKAKPKDALKITKLDFSVIDQKKPLDAAYQMFHRALQSLYECRRDGYIKVSLGKSNELMVTSKEGETKLFSAATIRKAGNDALVTAKLVTQRGARKKTAPVNALTAVDANTAKPVINSIGSMLDAETFNPPITTDSENVVDQNDLAELALRCVLKINGKGNGEGMDELKGTLSQLIVAVMPMLNVKTFDAVQKMVKKAANA
jgi:hypothetical protein